VLAGEAVAEMRALVEEVDMVRRRTFVAGGRGSAIGRDCPGEGELGPHLVNAGQQPATVRNPSVASTGCGVQVCYAYVYYDRRSTNFKSCMQPFEKFNRVS
jgi:hypothetical protein